jgi:hypothetical protein
VLVFGLAYLRFFLDLLAKTRWLFAVAGTPKLRAPWAWRCLRGLGDPYGSWRDVHDMSSLTFRRNRCSRRVLRDGRYYNFPLRSSAVHKLFEPSRGAPSSVTRKPILRRT